MAWTLAFDEGVMSFFEVVLGESLIKEQEAVPEEKEKKRKFPDVFSILRRVF